MTPPGWTMCGGVVPSLLLTLAGAAPVARAGADAKASETSPDTIRGVVRAAAGPVAGATVRVQATERVTLTDSGGRFALAGAEPQDGLVVLTAWAPGFFCGGPVEASPGDGAVVLELEPHAAGDDSTYAWLPSTPVPGVDSLHTCSTCHARHGDPGAAELPVNQWLADSHSGSARNPRFLSLYAGTDLAGREGGGRRYGRSRDYGRFPIGLDTTNADVGPGYRLDFPGTAGNCGACHVPLAAVSEPYGVDPRDVADIAREGVSCDFCHKIWDVRLDPATGLPFRHMPGVLSYELRRPAPGGQFFAGPLDDVAPGEDTFLPLQRGSAFCAPCHYGVFWDTVVYDSYGEWLRSPYSEPETGRTCQDCHMPRGGATRFALGDRGGLERDPATIATHRMPGARDTALLRSALSLEVEARRAGEALVVQVRVSNDRTGHHVPTDSPLRSVMLLVSARDGNGDPLDLLDGPTLPAWAGEGEPADGAYAGLAGRAFAKVLQELWTGEAPTAAYWNPVRVVADTRIAAFAADTSVYRFVAPPGTTRVNARLIYRRAFRTLADQKGWNEPDVPMAGATVRLAAQEESRSASARRK